MYIDQSFFETKNLTSGKAILTEQHLYGASRLGMRQTAKILYNNGALAPIPGPVYQNVAGERYYEITNHLGNVNVVIKDRKTATGGGIGSLYEAVEIQTADYYPFGMLMPGRNPSPSERYRYAYNGMELDKEVKGDGNSYTTEFRQYDPRLGRWLSLDPLMMQFPWMSPYVAFDNNPVYYIDPLGLKGGPATEVRTYNVTELSCSEVESEYLPSKGVEKGVEINFIIKRKQSDLRQGDVTRVKYKSLGDGTWERYKEVYKDPSGYGSSIVNGAQGVSGFSKLDAWIHPANVVKSEITIAGTKTGNDIKGSGVSSGGSAVPTTGSMGGKPTKNSPTPENVQSTGETVLTGAQIVSEVTDITGSGAEKILDDRSSYGKLAKNQEITVRTPGGNINMSSKVLKAAKVVGKVANFANVISTGYSVYTDIKDKKYKAAAARTTVAAVATACIFIPGPGWIIAGAIGIADAIWGDDFYNWLEK